MDLKAFSGESFDVKEWINQTFKSPEAQKQNKEQYASSLVMKLQLLIAKLNASIEEQSESVCQTLPRVVRDTESLQQEALLLQAKMAAVQEEIDKVNRETGSSMSTLVQLGIFKERIEATRKALKEADNWTTLTAEIEDAIDSGDLQLIAEKLVGIQSSLKILSHVPDFEDRVMHVEGLKNRLEALASPQLVTAFNGSDAEKARFFVRIFREMERSQQLLKYYRKCLKARVLKSWERTVGERQHQTVLEWAKAFFESVESILKEQIAWIKSVFTDANPTEHLIQVLLEVFAGMEPRLDFCIQAGLKQQDEPLNFLIEVKKCMNCHVHSWDGLLCTDLTQNAANLRELCKLFFSPFKQYASKYSQMESSLLLSDLVANTQTSKDMIDELRNVSNSVGKLIASFTAASKRCCELTEGCAFPGLKSALEDCLSSYLDRYSRLMRRLDKRKSATNSFSILQQSLSLNQTSGELLLQLEQLDITLSIDFLERTKHFLGPDARDRVLDQHYLFLLEPSAVEKLEEFYNAVKQGSRYPVLSSSLKIVSKLCSELQSSTFSIIFHPVQEELSSVPNLEVWASSSAGSDSREPEMPDFSFSPQEYITQIGQYLMTLPQHLEPYMTNENPALTRALREGVFPYCSGILESGAENPADFLLACVAKAACESYQAAILKIHALSANSTKQLATDIGYLGDILEDLGHPLSEGLKAVIVLLKLPAKDYWVQSTGCPQKLVSAIRQMRNLSMS